MPSSAARMDWGANANATKFKMDPEMKMVVPIIQVVDSHESISPLSSTSSPSSLLPPYANKPPQIRSDAVEAQTSNTRQISLSPTFFAFASSSSAAASFSLISNCVMPRLWRLFPEKRKGQGLNFASFKQRKKAWGLKITNRY